MTLAAVYGPTGDQLDTLMGGDRASIARRARELGGVQVLVMRDDGSRECWTRPTLDAPWQRAWRREGPSPARDGAKEGAAATGRGRDGLDDMRASTGLEGAR